VLNKYIKIESKSNSTLFSIKQGVIRGKRHDDDFIVYDCIKLNAQYDEGTFLSS